MLLCLVNRLPRCWIPTSSSLHGRGRELAQLGQQILCSPQVTVTLQLHADEKRAFDGWFGWNGCGS
jgi:hypothetical protein